MIFATKINFKQALKNWTWLGLFAVVVIGLAVRYWYQTPSQGVGSKAPDFTGILPSGDSIRLSDFRGKIVLLDFWGSWCGPCRRANKDMVEIYRKYAPSGQFEIISIGLESDRNNWLNAITKDQLDWKYHVSDVRRFNDHVALLYGVRSIPATILVDKEGVIVAVKPGKEELMGVLDGLVGG